MIKISFKFICDESISTDGLNLTMPAYSSATLLFTNKGIITGKKYWEITVTAGSKVVANSTIHIGIAIKSATKPTDSSYKGIYGDTSFNQNIFPQKIKYTGFNGININDTVGVAFDADNGKIKFSVNGVWFGDLDTGLTIGQEIFPVISDAYNVNCTVNFGASPFKYNIPDGYVACDNTKFLIKQNDKYYSIKDNQLIELTAPTTDEEKITLFNNNGVNNLDDLTEEDWNNLFPDKSGLQILAYTKDNIDTITIEYNVPEYRPIDKLEDQFQIKKYIPGASVPDTPTNLTASDISKDSSKLSWT